MFEKSKSSWTSIWIPSPTHQTSVVFENRNTRMEEHSGFEPWLKNELLIWRINPETYPSFVPLLSKMPNPNYVIEMLNVIDNLLTNELKDVRDKSEIEVQELKERNWSLSRESNWSQRSLLYKQYPDIIIKPYNLKVLEKAFDKGVNVHDVRC